MRPEDRRTAPRYAPAVDQAQVGWWDGADFHSTPARLQDISVGGASLAVGPASPVASTVWFRLAGGGTAEWVQADSAEVAVGEDGVRRLRLAFTQVCSYDLFKEAVWGQPAAPEPPPRALAPADPTPPAAAPAAARPPRADSQRPGPAERAGPTYVVLATLAEAPPTLRQAELAQRALRDRAAVLPWALALAAGLAVAALLCVTVATRLAGLHPLANLLGAKGP